MQPSAPFWAALGAPLPWHGSGAATYLYIPDKDEPAPHGFIQAIKRFGRPEADVVRIAPKEIEDEQMSIVWERLLKHVVSEAGEHGIQRLYIYIDTASPSYELICKSGFTPYISETLFRLSGIPDWITHRTTAASVRPQKEADSFALQRLTSRFTPSVVQKADGLFSNNGEISPFLPLRAWRLNDSNDGFVLEEKGEIIAASQIHQGRAGHWICLFGDPHTPESMKPLLEQTLFTLKHYRDRPIYCSLRPYQNAFGPLLRNHNFEVGPEMTRFVKHTTRSVKYPGVEMNREVVEGSAPGLAPIDIN